MRQGKGSYPSLIRAFSFTQEYNIERITTQINKKQTIVTIKAETTMYIVYTYIQLYDLHYFMAKI